MDYQKIYNQIIENSRNRRLEEYAERHHIVPRCMGGTDEHSNIAILTPEEHFLCHMLLVKMYPTHGKLAAAVQAMSMSSHLTIDRPSRRLYGWLRRRYSEHLAKSNVGEGNSQYGTRWKWITDGTRNRKIKLEDAIDAGWRKGLTPTLRMIEAKNKYWTSEKRQQHAEYMQNREISADTRLKMSKAVHNNHSFKIAWKQSIESRKGQKMTALARQKMSQSKINTAKYQCPHCERWFTPNNLSRYHGDRCPNASNVYSVAQ